MYSRLKKQTLLKMLYFFLWLIILIGYHYYASFFDYRLQGVEKSALLQFYIFIFGYVILSLCNKSFVSLYGLFLAVFYLFQNGQILLYVLDVDFDRFYVLVYGDEILLSSIIFSTKCLIVAFMAGMFSMKKLNSNTIYGKINQLDRFKVISLLKKIWIISAAVTIPYTFIRFYITSTSGYFAMMEFVGKATSVPQITEKVFVSSTILLLVYQENYKRFYKVLMMIFLLWSVVISLAGDRTIGLAGIVVLSLIKFLIGDRKNKVRLSSYFVLFLGTMAIIYLISISFSYRMNNGSTDLGIGETVIYAVSTLGFSFFPLSSTINIVPEYIPLMNGKSFLGGIVAGFIPSSFDVLGIMKKFSEWNSYPTDLLGRVYNYSFGLDYSLNAEAYINFGTKGWIAMFFICSIIASCLKQVDFSRVDNLFSQYAGLILLYSWFTLPRRKLYYVFNNIFWYIVFIGGLLLITYYIRIKTERRK